METLEGNKLIAEFMGRPDYIRPNLRSYHESWDLLMPVGKKILDWVTERERPNANACDKLDMLEADITCYIREYDIERAHKAVIKWIELYNSQPK